MKQLILDRSKWRSGRYSDRSTGDGPTELLNSLGYMCCLGQFALQLGFTREEILYKTVPANLDRQMGPFTAPWENRFRPYCNTELSADLMTINDARETTPEEKIEKIRNLLAEHGIELIEGELNV